MADNNRYYRIRTNLGQNTNINVNLDQDFDILEILSLKIDRKNLYKLHTSNYGCVAGRVLANGSFGIPNAKISVFIESDTTEMNSIISSLYPYSTVSSQDNNGTRYNLLPEEQVSDCHTPVGTFPSKRMILDDNTSLEIFDTYYKYTTRSNNAGDYMLFGVPVGTQTLHVDIDLSDIGVLSQRPIDLVYKGYDINEFESPSQFKKDTNLDNLAQLITDNYSITVNPFWGDNTSNTVSITRQDVEVKYKFEPTCVFVGSIITDNKSNGVTKECVASNRMGKMNDLTTGSGTIEMIRKKTDGTVEEFAIKGTHLIDGNGTWCYQIPMNLDYMSTDEYGNLVPSEDPTKGIPTRARVRFRVSLTDYDSDYANNHLAKVLVPNNPKSYDELDYVFGTNTKDDKFATKSFRDLFWNKVYTVKSYIPRIQNGDKPNKNRHFTGFKQINVYDGNNPLPYNNIRIDINFTFTLICMLIKALLKIVSFANKIIGALGSISSTSKRCLTIGGGLCPGLENFWFAPGCKRRHLEKTFKDMTNTEALESTKDAYSVDDRNAGDDDDLVCLTRRVAHFKQCIEISLAMEHNVIQFDFYNDWINGMLYIPRWFMTLRKKRSWLFGLIKRKAKIQACMESTFNKRRNLVQQCSLTYAKDTNGNFTNVVTPNGCKSQKSLSCHKTNGTISAHILKKTNLGGGGLVHDEKTLKQQSVYYFKPAEWLDNSAGISRCNLFATDIVLLGSLDECDKNGLPQAFRYLSQTSYKMPQNLVSTNMQSEGYLFSRSGGSTICRGNGNRGDYETGGDSLTIQENTLSHTFYQQWAKTNQLASDLTLDNDDYAISEASGIDWGVVGPNQGNDNRNHLYHPGGHFLGIGCMNAETDVKSCVNLSRICEIGAMMSQRKSFVTEANTESGYRFDYLSPTGLISNIDIDDGDFRRMFATLNYNGLKTVYDPETLLLKYDIEPLMPFGFNGELYNKVQNSSYIKKVGDNDNAEEPGQSPSSSKLYRYVNEMGSDDYYKFRFGVKSGDNLRSKYLRINDDGTVSIPMYENSFYFYFGLKDGNTAYDRFLKDFYSQCPISESKAETVIVEAESLTYYETNSGGTLVNVYTKYDTKISVSVSNMMLPFTYVLYKGDDYVTSGTVETTDFEIKLEKTKGKEKELLGNYQLLVSDSDLTTAEGNFSVTSMLDSSVKDVEAVAYNCSAENINDGRIMVFNLGDNITKVTATYALNPSISGSAEAKNGSAMIEGLQGNLIYSVYVKMEHYTEDVFIGEYEISAPAELDFYIANKGITGKRLMNYIMSDSGAVNDNWLERMSENHTGFTDEEWECLKRALYFDNDSGTSESVEIGCVGGTPPYTMELVGCGERLIGNSSESIVSVSCFNDEETNFNNGFDISLYDIYEPTNSDKKCNYYVNFSDSNEDSVSFGKAYFDYSSLYTLNAQKEKPRINLFFDLLCENGEAVEGDNVFDFMFFSALSCNVEQGKSLHCNLSIKYNVIYSATTETVKTFEINGDMDIPSMYDPIQDSDWLTLMDNLTITEIDTIEGVLINENPTISKAFCDANDKLGETISAITIDYITINSMSDYGPFVDDVDIYVGYGAYINTGCVKIYDDSIPDTDNVVVEIVDGYKIGEHYPKVSIYMDGKIVREKTTGDSETDHYNKADYVKFTEWSKIYKELDASTNMVNVTAIDKETNLPLYPSATINPLYKILDTSKLYIPIPKQLNKSSNG